MYSSPKKCCMYSFIFVNSDYNGMFIIFPLVCLHVFPLSLLSPEDLHTFFKNGSIILMAIIIVGLCVIQFGA